MCIRDFTGSGQLKESPVSSFRRLKESLFCFLHFSYLLSESQYRFIDIAGISVLKDAAASIYGSTAATWRR
ncbi:MAG: hypothetical protein PHI28_13420 [Mangrovibacterium sp.]|nr:hypothetical protein [Mangrovibacterium sp.]